MSLIDATYFKGEILVAQRSQPEVQEALQSFIDKYEPKILNVLMGASFYALFKAGLLEDPIDDRWISLRDGTDLKQIIANYVYFWYIRNQATQTVGVGEVKPSTDNAILTSATDKTVRAWNEMVDMCRDFTLDTTIYPEWTSTYHALSDGCLYGNYCYPDIFNKINSLNI